MDTVKDLNSTVVRAEADALSSHVQPLYLHK